MLDLRRLAKAVAALLLTLTVAPSALLAAPLAVARNRDLAFGSFVGGAGHAGTVTVDASGSRTATGTVRLLSAQAFSAAQFTITGNGGTRYTVTLPASVLLTSGTAQLSASQLTSSIPATGVLPAAGSLTFTVGATLTVNTTQSSGSYSGSINVSVVKN